MEGNYSLLKRVKIGNQQISYYQSLNDIDPFWDDFLDSTDQAHFEQYSAWARAKKISGWSYSRIVVDINGQVIGGVQVLCKKIFGIFKVGLLMKGPVIKPRDPILAGLVINFLKEYSRKNLTGLLVQPPEEYSEIYQIMIRSGFIQNSISYIIKSATVVINLSSPEEILLKNMKRQKRQNIRTAYDAGIIIREGKRDELATFFNLMCTTCERRGVSPNPASLKILEGLWDSLVPTKRIKLFLAQFQNEIISGILVIISGNRIYLWKFGWSGKYSNFHPNELLFWEIFKWAKQAGYLIADLGYITSYKRWQGKFGDEENGWKDRTDISFKLGLGGQIQKLPPAAVYFPFIIFRWLYKYLVPVLDSMTITRKKLIKLID